MSLNAIVNWPTYLPLPYVDASGEPLHATLASSLEHARIQRRQRHTAVVVSLSVRWVLGLQEYDNFKDFFATDLGNGAAKFVLELRYPKNSVLTEWRVQFMGGYTSTYEDHNWGVEAVLNLHEVVEAVVPEPELPLAWTGFQVMSAEESAGDWDSFVDADGYEFYTKT